MWKLGTAIALVLFATGCEGELVAHSEAEAGTGALDDGPANLPADVEPMVLSAPAPTLVQAEASNRPVNVKRITTGDVKVTGDAYQVQEARVEGNVLYVEVVYGGGCRPHRFDMAWDLTFRGATTGGMAARVGLKHDRREDHCQALVAEEVAFNLTTIAETYKDIYARSGGSLEIQFSGQTAVTRYDF